jgi:hypothetical protein
MSQVVENITHFVDYAAKLDGDEKARRRCSATVCFRHSDMRVIRRQELHSNTV